VKNYRTQVAASYRRLLLKHHAKMHSAHLTGEVPNRMVVGFTTGLKVSS
jgi:hypothetical protein